MKSASLPCSIRYTIKVLWEPLEKMMSSGCEAMPPSLLVINSATDFWIWGIPQDEAEYEPAMAN